MKQTVRWGIIGCGYVAEQFARALKINADCELVAVASKSEETATSFAKKHQVPIFHACYEDLATSRDVDIVYIANLHPAHKTSALMCLKNGKAVLVEKPMAVNAAEVSEIVNEARIRGLFLMEGVWTRFLPVIQTAKRWIHDGRIGKVRMIKADFGFATAGGTGGRHLNPQHAGGALLDVGIYPISLSTFLLDKFPVDIKTKAFIGSTGVDEFSSYLLTFDDGELALLSSAVTLNTSQDAEIIGDLGRIVLPDFWRGQKILFIGKDGRHDEVELPFQQNGFEYEIEEVVRCLHVGSKESLVMPWHESLKTAELMDSIRSQWKLRYPME